MKLKAPGSSNNFCSRHKHSHGRRIDPDPGLHYVQFSSYNNLGYGLSGQPIDEAFCNFFRDPSRFHNKFGIRFHFVRHDKIAWRVKSSHVHDMNELQKFLT